MPGRAACFRCGSVLDGTAVTVDVHPPRAPRWVKPFRRMHYWLRRHTALKKIEEAADKAVARASTVAGDKLDLLGMARASRRLSPWGDIRKLSAQTFGWMALSALPGLPQLIQKRFRLIFQLWVSWLISLASGLFFFGRGWFGATSLGIAVVLHAWIAADAALLLKRLKRILPRIVGLGIAIAWVCVVYWGVRVMVLRSIVGGESLLTLTQQRVEVHDYLLCWRLASDPVPLRRGDLVLVNLPHEIRRLVRVRVPGRRHGRGRMEIPEIRGVGQLIGLPGENVQVAEGRFSVNGEELDPERYQVPGWLQDRKVAISLGIDEYFVKMGTEVRLQGHYRLEEIVRLTLVVRQEAIRGRAFMRWSPLKRRGFLSRESE